MGAMVQEAREQVGWGMLVILPRDLLIPLRNRNPEALDAQRILSLKLEKQSITETVGRGKIILFSSTGQAGFELHSSLISSFSLRMHFLIFTPTLWSLSCPVHFNFSWLCSLYVLKTLRNQTKFKTRRSWQFSWEDWTNIQTSTHLLNHSSVQQILVNHPLYFRQSGLEAFLFTLSLFLDRKVGSQMSNSNAG